MTWTTIDTWSTDDMVTATILNEQYKGNLDHLYGNLPQRATMWHEEATVTNGNAIAIFVSASQIHCSVPRQNAAADADAFTHSFVVEAGTYTLYLLGATDSSFGIIDWEVDGSSIATGQDWYSAGTTYNVIKTVASVTISEGGRHVLTGTVNGKNGSSSGYTIVLTKYWLKQAADT